MLNLIQYNEEPFENLLTIGEEILVELQHAIDDLEYQDDLFIRLSTYYGLMYRLNPDHITPLTKLRAPQVNREIIKLIRERFATLTSDQVKEILHGKDSLLKAYQEQIQLLPAVFDEEKQLLLLQAIKSTSLKLIQDLVDQAFFLSNLDLMVDLNVHTPTDHDLLSECESKLLDILNNLNKNAQLLLPIANELEWLGDLVHSSALETDPVVSELLNLCQTVNLKASMADEGLLDEPFLELRSCFNLHQAEESASRAIKLDSPPRRLLAADDGQSILDLEYDDFDPIELNQTPSKYQIHLTKYSFESDDGTHSHRLLLQIQHKDQSTPTGISVYGLKMNQETSESLKPLNAPEDPKSLYFDVTFFTMITIQDGDKVVYTFEMLIPEID